VEWDVIIKQVTRHRRPATEAVLLYEETPESVEQRRLESERRRGQREERDMDPGRPSKRQRRNLMQLKRS
jgi:ribosome-associated heat shock protein Hsp15